LTSAAFQPLFGIFGHKDEQRDIVLLYYTL